MQVKRIQNGELGELCIGHPGSALYSVLPSALAAFASRSRPIGRAIPFPHQPELSPCMLRF